MRAFYDAAETCHSKSDLLW